MLSIQNLTLMRGAKVLLRDANLTANLGDRIGLVGNNGTGKTSLFGVLRAEVGIEAGSADWPRVWRTAYVAQETPALDTPASDYVMQGDVALWDVMQEAEHSHDMDRLAHLHTQMEDMDAYTARPRAEALLAGLGFLQSDMQRPVAEFSGGWRMRLNLARALMAPSEILLLDEPTNHLDLDTIVWLERWLNQYRGLLIIISHDREFLDGVVKTIVHIDQQKLVRYTGNYSGFEFMRAERLSQQRAALSRQAEHVAKLERFVARFKAKASKAKQAQSRVKMLEKLERVAPILANNPVAFDFDEPERTPDPLLTMENVACGYPGRAVLSGVKLMVRSGSRIGLLGANGAGKSTLVKTIAGEIAALSGDLRPAKWLNIGYFAQHQLDMLDLDGSPLLHMRRLDPTAREQELRNFLGRFHFRGDMVTAAVGPFSGGEKARLALAMIVYGKPNLLLLDEPTNHLDLETREALTAALAEYEGTLILVSHDRHLLRATADELWLVADGGVREFDGDLEDYRNWLTESKTAARNSAKNASKAAASAPLPAAAPASKSVNSATAPAAAAVNTTAKSAAKPAAAAPDRKEDRRQSAQDRQRLAEQRKPLTQRLARLEKKLAEKQAKLAELDQALADPALYEAGDGGKISSLTQDQAYTAREIETLETEWLELHEQIEAIV
jgi:ATP-binding cassette subfamily F protein 3